MNLIALRDLAIPLAREWEKEGKLDFDIPSKCLFGCAKSLSYFDFSNRGCEYAKLAVDFGITADSARTLFGTKSYGSLSAREAVLNKLIAQRTAVLV
jgi:hypothetical protein